MPSIFSVFREILKNSWRNFPLHFAQMNNEIVVHRRYIPSVSISIVVVELIYLYWPSQWRGRDSWLGAGPGWVTKRERERVSVGKVANFMPRLFRLGRKAVPRFSALLVIWHRLRYQPAGAVNDLAVITKLDEFPQLWIPRTFKVFVTVVRISISRTLWIESSKTEYQRQLTMLVEQLTWFLRLSHGNARMLQLVRVGVRLIVNYVGCLIFH